jgi:hypothetical protein
MFPQHLGSLRRCIASSAALLHQPLIVCGSLFVGHDMRLASGWRQQQAQPSLP